MSLSPEMMQILIQEYFLDPYQLGYRKYGLMSRNNTLIFYVPQILALLNEPRTDLNTFDFSEDGEHISRTEQVYRKRSLPSRISQLFSNIPGAPNAIGVQDIIDTYTYYVTNHPEIPVPDYIISE